VNHKYKLTPEYEKRDKCLILVGGSGDSIEKLLPLADILSKVINSHTICTLTLSQESEVENILDIQSQELFDIFSIFKNEQAFSVIDLLCTSMGAVPTTRILQKSKFANYFTKVIFFDPADYNIDYSPTSQNNHTWAGYQSYTKSKPTVADELKNINISSTIDVIHLTLRNQSSSGYYDEEYVDRGRDHADGFPRLNTDMVKAFYLNTPNVNKGEYIEISGIPHGFVRDGDVTQNLHKVAEVTKKLLE